LNAPFYDETSFVPPTSIGYLVKHIAKQMMMQAELVFADRELSFSQWVAMTLIRHEIADNCAAIARQLGHTSGATTRLVDQLDERGLVRRSREGDDRRVVKLELTAAGVLALDALAPRMIDFWNTLLVDFERNEVETMITLLSRLLSALEAQQDQGRLVA